MGMDMNLVRERFGSMTREELLEEVALHESDYEPLARDILKSEAHARGITSMEIGACREAAAQPEPAEQIDFPALLTSSMDKEDVRDLATALRREGIPALVREVDTRGYHRSGCTVGRWGLFVSGPRAQEAARLLDTLLPATAIDAQTACGGCGGACEGEDELEPGEWDEDGDWWKTDVGDEKETKGGG